MLPIPSRLKKKGSIKSTNKNIPCTKHMKVMRKMFLEEPGLTGDTLLPESLYTHTHSYFHKYYIIM